MTVSELEDAANSEREYANKLFADYQKSRAKFLEKLQEFQNKQTKENYQICRDDYRWVCGRFYDALASWENATDVEIELYQRYKIFTVPTERPKNDLVRPECPVKWAE